MPNLAPGGSYLVPAHGYMSQPQWSEVYVDREDYSAWLIEAIRVGLPGTPTILSSGPGFNTGTFPAGYYNFVVTAIEPGGGETLPSAEVQVHVSLVGINDFLIVAGVTGTQNFVPAKWRVYFTSAAVGVGVTGGENRYVDFLPGTNLAIENPTDGTAGTPPVVSTAVGVIDLTLEDAPTPGGFTPIADPSGTRLGMRGTDTLKWTVSGTHKYLTALYQVRSGAWSIRATPVYGDVDVGFGSSVATDRSGTIAAGGTAQQLAPANGSRRYLLIENPSTAAGQGIATAESLWINFTTTAIVGPPSIELVSGGSLVMQAPSFVSSELVSVIAATTGHKWAAKEG